MEKRQHIFILGNSLILGVIGESLLHSGQFEVTSLVLPEDVRELEPMKPDAILFDLEAPHMESVFFPVGELSQAPSDRHQPGHQHRQDVGWPAIAGAVNARPAGYDKGSAGCFTT